MRRITLILSLLLALFTMADEVPLASLVRVTSAEEMHANEQYIFARNGRVLIESASSPLPTTADWRTDSLTGDETYIWTLVTLGSTEGFYIVGHYGLYLSNPKSSELMSTVSPQTRWTFEFAEDSTATICTTNTSPVRFIGEKPAYSGQYTAPSVSSLSSYPHDFIIYRLVFPHPEPAEDPESTAIHQPSSPSHHSGTLLLRNGTILIEQNGVQYNVLGTRL